MIEPAILRDKKRRLDYAIGIVIGHLIAEAINEINLALDSNKSRWITIHPNGKKHKGRACKIDLETGQIKGGNLPQHVYNKPLKEAFEKSNQSEDIHYFALQEKSLPQQGNVRFTLKPKTLTPEELKAATTQGRQILKDNPLPKRFKDKYEGIAYLKKLLPNTRLYLDSLPVNVIHRIATALSLFGQYFPFILVHGLDEINEYQHKVALYDSQTKQREQVINSLKSNKDFINDLKIKSEQTIKLFNNSIIGLPESKLKDVFDTFGISYLITNADRKTDGSLKDDVYKNILKALFKSKYEKAEQNALFEKDLIADHPKRIDNNVAAYFEDGSITLNGLYYGYESDRKIKNLYSSKVQEEWTFELSSKFNPHISILIHELAHAIDSQIALSQSQTIIVDYNNYVKEMRQKKEKSYASVNVSEYVAQNISEAITAKHKSEKAKQLLKHAISLFHQNVQRD